VHQTVPMGALLLHSHQRVYTEYTESGEFFRVPEGVRDAVGHTVAGPEPWDTGERSPYEKGAASAPIQFSARDGFSLFRSPVARIPAPC
jgi:hypothetical protein